MRIVCDTNVIISALLFPGGAPDQIWKSILSAQYEHATSPDILTELRRVFTVKFELASDRLEALLELIRTSSFLVYPSERLHIVHEDESDNRILECAREAKAQAIITGDQRHLLPLKSFEGILLLSPREFLTRAEGV